MIKIEKTNEKYCRRVRIWIDDMVVFSVEQWCHDDEVLIAPWIDHKGPNWKSEVWDELPEALSIATDLAKEWDKDTGKKSLSEVKEK